MSSIVKKIKLITVIHGRAPELVGGRDLKIFEGGEYFGKKFFWGIDFSSSKGGIS